mmetsp:Transcript_55371/g.161630  ORF Transcript_55371/g.161630 Transcript_55371/m.161630 type:complete len:254 (+) Transcript_55371:1119-1880(+)
MRARLTSEGPPRPRRCSSSTSCRRPACTHARSSMSGTPKGNESAVTRPGIACNNRRTKVTSEPPFSWPSGLQSFSTALRVARSSGATQRCLPASRRLPQVAREKERAAGCKRKKTSQTVRYSHTVDSEAPPPVDRSSRKTSNKRDSIRPRPQSHRLRQSSLPGPQQLLLLLLAFAATTETSDLHAQHRPAKQQQLPTSPSGRTHKSPSRFPVKARQCELPHSSSHPLVRGCRAMPAPRPAPARSPAAACRGGP